MHPTVECVDRAEQRRAFHRALRVPGQLDVSALEVFVSDEVSDRVSNRVVATVIDRGRRQAENS